MPNTTEKENACLSLNYVDAKPENKEHKLSEASSLIQVNDNASKAPSAENLNNIASKSYSW